MNIRQNSVSMHHENEIAAHNIECLICPFYEKNITLDCLPINATTEHHLNSVLIDEKFTGKSGELLAVHGLAVREPLHDESATKPELDRAQNRIKKFIFIGLGKQSENSILNFRKAFKKTFDTIAKQSMEHLGLYIPNAVNQHQEQLLDASIYGFYSAEYRFDKYKTVSQPSTAHNLKIFSELCAELTPRLAYVLAEQTGICLTKDLANMPANVCTPDYLVAQCKALDEKFEKISTTIIDEQALFDLNMHSYLAVNRASSYQASMPVMHYNGGESKQAHIVLIGKGVTFDTGGITLKGASGMEAMIYDMAGAACVLGVMHAVASLDLPINVTVILATAENAIDGSAYRPGDVLNTMSGQTVEVISTDAEGRLLLCDAISYAKRLKPNCIVDIATLTGAAITSLGHHANGLMCNDNDLQLALIAAGKSRYDRAWAFPIWEEYFDTLYSTCADMKNTGNNSPGMITAACFLSKFAEGVPWAHLDVAGTSFLYGKQNTATGRPLPLLLKFIQEQANIN